MALEDHRCKILYAFWLAKINAMRKYDKVPWLHYQTKKEPSAELQQYENSCLIFTLWMVWIRGRILILANQPDKYVIR
jgi:hypothetical protein